MFDGKFIATIFAIVISVFAICNFNTKKITSIEGFFPARTVKIDPEYQVNGNFYSTPPNFQLNPSFRMQNATLSPYTRHHLQTNPNARANMATPQLKPTDFATMARENFTHENSYKEQSHSVGDFKTLVPDYSTATLPPQNMSTINTIGENGEEVQAVVYDRLIFANRNSNHRRHGDKIRGDLPIAPRKCGLWDPSVNPHIDLEPGAINVIAGIGNETSNEMATFLNGYNKSSIVAGVDMTSPDSLASIKNIQSLSNFSTLQVSAF
jgi:hypothetical protein